MFASARAYAYVLTVPLFGLSTGIALERHLDALVRNELLQAYPNENWSSRLENLTAAQFCTNTPELAGEGCSWVTLFRGLSFTCLAAVCMTLLLLAAITYAGRSARRSRQLLFRLFRPGMYLVAAALVLLVPVQAGILVISASWLLITYATGRIPAGYFLLVIIGAIAAAAAIIRSVFRIALPSLPRVPGLPIDAHRAPRLWGMCREIAAQLGAAPPEHVVVGLDPTFFVTQSGVHTFAGPVRGETLYCSLPMARVLSPSELKAVLGHELGHFAGEDTQYSARFYPIYRGVSDALVQLSFAGQSNLAMRIASLPALAIFGHLFEAFALAEREHSRARELAADQAGARVTSPEVLAATLVKLHAFIVAARHADEEGWSADAATTPNESAELVAATLPLITRSLPDLASAQVEHPIDSHPTLATRLTALGIELRSLDASTLQYIQSEPAIGLIDDYEQIEHSLTEAASNEQSLDANESKHAAA